MYASVNELIGSHALQVGRREGNNSQYKLEHTFPCISAVNCSGQEAQGGVRETGEGEKAVGLIERDDGGSER